MLLLITRKDFTAFPPTCLDVVVDLECGVLTNRNLSGPEKLTLQKCFLSGKTCDSKSDGSLHGNQHAEDGPRPPNQRRVKAAAEEPQNRNVRSNFCTLL